MAKKSINKEIWNNVFKGLKRPVYSIDNHGLLDGLIVEDYEISDKLSNLNFEYGLNLDNYVDGASVPAIPETVTFIDGNASAYLKTIAAGFTAVEKNTTGTSDVVRVENWNAASNVSINGVDAGNIYGGIVVTTDCNCKTINFSTSTNRYENIEAIVEGPRTITVNTVKAKALYGGGAGYGSVLEGDVSLNIVGTNTISNVFGGGQKGAVVNGDVHIDISRRDAKSGRIGTVYGGGDDAVVNGDVYITVHGTNAIGVGTVSGSGKGKKSQVNGTRYLIIDGYSGDFKTTIKDFDHITLTSGTAITLKQSQQKSIQSAKYEFVIDQATLNQPNAMLTWNKKIDVGQFYITVADEFASNADDAFVTTIYSSTYLTQAAFDKAGMKVYDEAGKEITSGYSLEFVADEDNKGNAKKKGGAIVLKFDGTNADVTGEDTKNREFTAADDDINIRGKYVSASVDAKGGNNKITLQKDSVMAGNVTAGDGNDRFTVQSGAIMAGTVALGAGENEIDVLGGGEINGAIKLADGTAEKHVKNTIDVNGSISQIEGGNEFTDNTIWIKNENAVGYWEYDTLLGVRGGLDIALQGDVLSGEISLGEKRANFVHQDLDLTHSNGSNDTVYVTQASKWDGNINFGKGKDTLILNTPATANGPASHGTITAEDGDNVIVANQTGVTVDSDKMKLSGTDNILVVSNGVKATIAGMAIGDFETAYGQFGGLFLGQNAILDDGAGNYAVESFDGSMVLRGNLTVITPKDYTNPESENYSQELADRIGTFYTVGNGVNGVIDAAGFNINLNKDTTVSGEIYGLNGATITLLEGAKINGTVVGAADIYFKQNAGSEDFLFENDAGEAAQIRVAKNVVATVGSINGIAGTTFQGTDDFENDSALVTLNEDAALYAAQDENLLVGNVTKETDFAAKYGDMAKGRISVIDKVTAKVTFTDGKIYFGKKAAFKKGIAFVGDNTVDVQSQKIVLDHTQLDVENGTVAFNVLDGAELVFDGIVKGGDISEKIKINLDQNARFAYGENMETGSWDKEFDNDKRDGRTNITFREDSQIRNKINLDAAGEGLTVNLEDGVQVKGKLGKLAEDAAVVTLGQGEDTLNVKKATVDGVIEAENDGGVKDVINLAGSTVNGMKAPNNETAISLDNADQVFMTDKAKVNGDIVGGDLVHITDSEVTGSIEAAKNVLVGAKVATVKGGDTFVESGLDASGTESTIGLVDASNKDVAVFADDAKATIGAIQGAAGNTIQIEARNKGTVALSNVDTTVGDVSFRAYHDGSAVDFGGDVKLTADNATFSAEEGGELKNLGNVQVNGEFTGDIKTLAGTTAAAQTATLASVNGKAITAGDVTFVAGDSAINLESKGSFNTLGAIAQSGALTKDGYGRVTDAAAATKAEIALGEETFLSAKSVEQVAADADIAVGGNGGLTVDGDIAQKKFATADILAGDFADDGTPQEGALSVGGNIVQESEEADATAKVRSLGKLEVKGEDGIVQHVAGDARVSSIGETNVAGGIMQITDVGDSSIVLSGENSVGGNVVQSVDNNKARVVLEGTTEVKGLVSQIGDKNVVRVSGDAKVGGGIVQKRINHDSEAVAAQRAAVVIDGTVDGTVWQMANNAVVRLDKGAEIASVGAVTQTGGLSARVIGKAEVTQEYTYEPFSEALEDKNIAALERKVGEVSQENMKNVVKLGATVLADGEYDDANHHKAAKVNIGSVALSAGDIEQVGDKNVVKASVDYTAQGESDVTIGATSIELGNITQLSDEGTLKLNKVEITAAQTMGAEAQSVMTLGDITGKVGAIDQKAFKAQNKVNIDVATTEQDNLTVGNVKMDVEGGITMLAYGGTEADNTLNLAGNVNVAGDVKVGGVIDGENISEDSVWGDRTADKNTVDIAADTVKIDGNLSLVGLTNKLTLENESYFKGDTEAKNPVAKDIALAGKRNTVDVAAGVKLDNIALYDLIDHDGIGVEGYDLTTDGNYSNEITIRGEAAGLVLNKQLRANDTINVYGGKIEGGLVTGNGKDTINLGNDGKLIEGADGTMAARVMGDVTIGGDVSMGVAGEADGSNTLTAEAFAARDLANPDADVAHNVAIDGKVEMYAGKNSKTDVAASNTLSLAGTGVYNADTGLTTVGTAKIGGAVTMVAENAYDANGVLDEGTNEINMGPLSTIGGDVTMTAYSQNTINVLASEEIVKEADVNAYAEITGKVDMTGKENEINVSGAAGSDTAAQGAAAYMNGISMANKYADQDGKEYIIADATNTITVGKDGIGSELIVGTSVSETADVAMGTIAYRKPDSQAVNWELVSVEKAAKGHDVLTYLGEMDAVVTDLTYQNRIDVTGRFDANDVTMMAKHNIITVTGDGDLRKSNYPELASEEVRTASFTANTVTQIAGLGSDNSITAAGTDSLKHYGYALLDPVEGEYDVNLSPIAVLPSVRFTAGDINQLQYGTVAGGQTAVNNSVLLTDFTIAKTGDITQLGEGNNKVTVVGYEATSLDPNQTLADMGLETERSTVGAIAQGSKALLGNDNTVELTRTDAGTIAQFAVNDNQVYMDQSTSGKISQTVGGSNYALLKDSTSGEIEQAPLAGEEGDNVNVVDLYGATTGKITQTAHLHNTVAAQSLDGFSQDALTDEEKEAGEVEGKINFQQSKIDGDIVQTSNKLVGELDSEAYGNEVEAYDTNITGEIVQTGATENLVNVWGRKEDITFTNDAGNDATYEKAYNVAVGGDITQVGAYLNEVDLNNADAGAINQNGTAKNTVQLFADTVAAAENVGKRPEGEASDDCDFGDGNTHVTTTIKSQADFNTRTVGDIVQTAGVADADELQALKDASVYTAANEVYADNMTLGTVTQTHQEGVNNLQVNASYAIAGKLTKLGEYAGEISNALDPITHVAEYEVYQANTLGNIEQTGTANIVSMMSVAAGKVTQTTQAPTFDAAAQIGYNELYTSAVNDATAKYVAVASWDAATASEVFTKTLLEGSANVRAANTLGAINQFNAATDNYNDQVENIVSLGNTTVEGEELLGGKVAVSQKGAVNGNVANSFTAETEAQEKVDAYTDENGEVQTVDYHQTTLDNINGAFIQEGFDNTATLTNVNVNGNVDQTVNMISTVAGHGGQLAGQNAGGNYLEFNGSIDAPVEGLELAEKPNIVRVKGTVNQTVNNDGDVKYVADLYSSNRIDATLANMGDVEQTITYGSNVIDIDSGALANKPQMLLETGNVTQTGTQNTIFAETTEMGVVEQNANALEDYGEASSNYVELVGSHTERWDEGTGTEEDPYVIVQQRLARYASAEAITQTTKQVADETLVEGKKLYDVSKVADDYENEVMATRATVGDITQNGEGIVENSVSFDGYEYQAFKVEEVPGATEGDPATTKIVEDGPAVKKNTLGTVTQTGVKNDAEINTALSVGDIFQTADSVDTVLATAVNEDVYQTVSKIDVIANNVDLEDVDQAGAIVQTATSDKFTTEFYKNGEVNAEIDPLVDRVVTASNDVEIDIANVGDVTQTIDGTAGVGNNKIDAEDANLGNVKQMTINGSNTVWSYTATTAEEAQSKTIGTITQDGLTNYVGTGDVETDAITQNANGVAADNTLSNEVEMQGVVLDAKAELKEGEDPTQLASYDFTPANVAKAKAESITQEVKAVAEQDDMFNAAMAATNTVTLTIADAGDVSQTGNANTTNEVTFNGATVPAKKIATTTKDDVTTVDDPLKIVDDPEGETTYPNTIGKVTQSGVSNTANITNAASVGELIKQDALSNKTIATVIDDKGDEDPTNDEMTVTTSQVDTIINELSLDNVATAGKIEQTATSDTFTTVKSEYVKDADGEWVLKEVEDPAVNPTETEGLVNADNNAELISVNSDPETAMGIDQKIIGTAGVGDNTITAYDSNLGNVWQETVDGVNYFYANTKTMQNESDPTDFVEASKKIGTIDQTGVMNGVMAGDWSDVDGIDDPKPELSTAGDVTTGAITQTANGVLTDDFLYNYVGMYGFAFDPAAKASPKKGAEDLSLTESWEFVPNGHVAAAKAESISQTANVKVKETLEDADGNPVEYFDGDAYVWNDVELYDADAGAIVQTGNANTDNTVTFIGAKVEEKTVTDVKVTPGEPGETYAHQTPPAEDAYTPVVESEKVNANTLATIDQTGVKNSVSIDTALAAGDITQVAEATKMISTTDDLDLDDVFDAGAMDMDADTAAATYGEDARKYFKDTVKNDPFTKVETAQSKTISNTLSLEDVGTVGSIEQTALGEEFLEETKYSWWHGKTAMEERGEVMETPYPQENLTKTETAYTDGINMVEIKEGTNVEGKITQTASGGYGTVDANVYQNHVKATGEIRQAVVTDPEEGEIAADNPQVVEAGAYLNSIGDVEQTLTSYATSFAYNAETNFIELSQINAGALKQVANGYAANLITSYPGTVVEKTVDPDDGYAEDAGTAKVTIASIEQEGFINTTRLDDVQIGAAPDGGAFVAADITLTATKVTKLDGDKEIQVIEGGLNTVNLSNVEVNNIVAKSEVTSLSMPDGKVITTEAAGANITLTNTTVTGGVYTGGETVEVDGFGSGDDTIKLYGTTKVVGEIDFGSNTYTVTPVEGSDDYLMHLNDNDKLELHGFELDLSQATIKGVEEIETIDSSTTLDVYAIETGDLKIDAAVVTISATKLDVGDIAVLDRTGYFGLETISAQADEDGNLTTAVDYTFNKGFNNDTEEGIGISLIKGSTAAGDKLTIGNGTDEVVLDSAVLMGIEVDDFNEVTFAHNATTQYVTWTDTTDSDTSSLKFTIADLGTTVGDIVTLGSFVVGEFSGYKASEVEINGFTSAENDDITYGTTWYNENNTLAYVYDSTTGMLSLYAPIA